MMNLKEFDDRYRKKYDTKILGIDEAGRGSLAGPLVVAGVIFSNKYVNLKINDSKKISKNLREKLYLEIIDEAENVFVEIIQSDEIDKVNILNATLKANNKIASLNKELFILTDYITLSDEFRFEKLVRGDSKSLSIAAASIVAKVVRDNIMNELDRVNPSYDFRNNKGYGTQKHLQAIDKYGKINVHRLSFKIKKFEK